MSRHCTIILNEILEFIQKETAIALHKIDLENNSPIVVSDVNWAAMCSEAKTLQRVLFFIKEKIRE